MKFTVAAFGMLAAVASAAAPRRMYFPRSNQTNPAEYSSQPAPVPSLAALATGGASSPPPAPDAGVESTTTTTMSSTIHSTITRYVRPSAAPESAGEAKPSALAGGKKEGRTTTTITSHMTTTVVVSKKRPAQTPAPPAAAAAAGPLGDGGAGGSQCAPSVVTVTASPSASTVYVTVTPQAVAPQAVTPQAIAPPAVTPQAVAPPAAAGGQQPPANPKPAATSQSTVTVVPYPSGNSTRANGAARPSGFARLHR